MESDKEERDDAVAKKGAEAMQAAKKRKGDLNSSHGRRLNGPTNAELQQEVSLFMSALTHAL